MPDTTSVIKAALDSNPDIQSQRGGSDDAVDTSNEPVDQNTDETGQTSDTSESIDKGEHLADDGDAVASEAAKDPATEGTTDADDAFAKEHGLVTKDKMGRPNRIPYPRVQKIAENTVRKTVEKVIGRKIADNETGEQALTGHITQITTRVRDLESEAENTSRGEWVMMNRPEVFLDILPQINPAYAELLKRPVEDAQPKADPNRPAPDYDLGNGQRTYTPEGLEKLFDWFGGKLREQALAETKKVLKPIEDERAQRDKWNNHVRNLEGRLNNAVENWPGFADHHEEILKVLQADKRISLEGAYGKVLNEKRTAAESLTKVEEQKVRAKILDEMANRPASTAASGAKPAARTDGKPKSGEDIIRESIRHLKR